MNHLLVILLPLLVIISSSGSAQNLDPELQKKIDEIIESTKKTGSVDQPILNTTKEVIDFSTRAQLDRKKPEGYYSTDCQLWKKINPQEQQGEANLTKMFYKTLEGGFPSHFNIPQQSMFSFDYQRLFYVKIQSDAITGLVNGIPVYREVSGKDMQSGLAGILQAVMLVSAEGSSSWLLTASKDVPRLLHMINSTDGALKNITSVVCTKDAKCFLVTKERSSLELKISSKEHVALKDIGVFSAERVNVFFRMCETIDSKDFNDDLASEIRTFESSCNRKIDAGLAGRVKERVSKICSELKYHILPMMKNYR